MQIKSVHLRVGECKEKSDYQPIPLTLMNHRNPIGNQGPSNAWRPKGRCTNASPYLPQSALPIAIPQNSTNPLPPPRQLPSAFAAAEARSTNKPENACASGMARSSKWQRSSEDHSNRPPDADSCVNAVAWKRTEVCVEWFRSRARPAHQSFNTVWISVSRA